MSDYSRFSDYGKSKKLRKEKTLRILPGSREDTGEWYRCWNCGFMNKMSRTVTGSGTNGGISQTIGTHSHSTQSGARQSVCLSGTFVLMNTGFNEKHNISPNVGSGCPLCGSLNTK